VPVPAFLARNIIRGETSRKQIALTFDGGAGDACAEQILDILKQKKLCCTMFLTGAFIKRYPQLVMRMVQEGHEIGNHTWSHPHLTTYEQDQQQRTRAGITRERLQQELTKTADLFLKITGRKMAPLWRAPFGEQNADIRRWAAEIGYLQIGWTTGGGQTMDSLDWVADSTSAIYHSSPEILQRLLQFGQHEASGANGGIILMHMDTQRRTDPAYSILPTLIDSMREQGYTFATISDIIRP
jgi:peptidoglycan/xylan/chitin deacetylase (PgdA/CDA1 family)